jgi:hypothetical protein
MPANWLGMVAIRINGAKSRGAVTLEVKYPHCKNGRIVDDVVRIGKGHTGLEPHVTEELIKLMLSAKN